MQRANVRERSMNNKSVYLIGDILVKNNEEYKKYVELVTPVAEKYGGEYLIIGGHVDSMESNSWSPNRIVLIKFPNKTAAMKWYNCDEYQPIKNLRTNNSVSNIIFVEGVS